MCTVMTVFQWFVHFQEGRESVEDDSRPGQPVSAWSIENVEKVSAFVMQDRQITTTLLAAEHLGYMKEVARQILERDLQKRKICSRFVEQFLASKSICVIQHPPYSPNLAPADFSFLPEGETGPKRRVFQQH
jgi:hypothetical protein